MQEDSEELTAVIQAGDDGGLAQGKHGDGERWAHSRNLLKAD